MLIPLSFGFAGRPAALRNSLNLITVIASMTFFLESPPGAAAQDVATINGAGSQTVKGWGSFPSYFRSDWSTTNEFVMFDKPAIQDAVFNLGLTHFRVDVEPRLYVSGTGVSDIVLNQTAVNDLVNQINIGRNHGVTNYIMSCWSPPAAWKDNGSIDGGHLVGADEPYYVNYYIKVLQTLNSSGVGLPQAISVQNEPDMSTSYDSCIYTDSGSGYALWRQLVQDMSAALNANGMSGVTVFGPECASTDNDIALLGASPNFGVVASDTTFNLALGNYACHTYGENIWLGLRSGFRDYPKDSWISEWSVDSNSDDGGTENGWTLDTLAHMASNFVDVPFNYWTWWTEWGYGSAAVGTTLVSGTQAPVYSERYWVLQRLWTTARPGWIVHSMTCDDPNYVTGNSAQNTWETRVDLMSFWSPDSSSSATLLVNDTVNATTMTVDGLVGTQYQAFQSDASQDMTNIDSGNVSGSDATVSLAPDSVTLLMTSSTVLPAPTGLFTYATVNGTLLKWPAVWGATGYNVKRASTSAGPYTNIGSTGVGAMLTFTDTTAVAGTSYYYEVSTLNPSGESGTNSSPASIQAPYQALPVADAYVWDGTNANTNFGTAPDMFVKAGPTNYNRQGYMRFNVSGMASASDVQVWLVPDSEGITAWNALPLAYEWVSSDTWSETGITWNNRPAGSGTLFGTYSGYYVGQTMRIDVTSRAQSQAAADGLLSMHIYSTLSGTDGNAWVDFGTKENTTPGYQPCIVYSTQPATVEPVADAYVQDGSDANTNFGSNPDLAVKDDATGYNRYSFLRFNVSGLANAASVKLRIVPDTVGSASGTTTFVYQLVPNNTWSESGITWNTMPSPFGATITSVTGYTAGQPVVIDVTSQAKAAAASGGLMSLVIYSTTYGSNNWVNFCSRENSNAANHPVLEYY